MDKIYLHAEEDFSSLGKYLPPASGYYLVYDRNVKTLVSTIQGVKASFGINASESAKTMDTVVDVCRFLMEENADRDAVLLALGGGVTTDLAGMAAGIYKRGIRLITLPTTLLSQVDAGIGGKTGVNLDDYKNILGVFHQPEFIYIARCTLDTLPKDQYLSGAAELIKTFIIGDAPAYRQAIAELSERQPLSTTLLKSAARIKCGIVERDPYEKGGRRVLNLGHTIGHAIEWCLPGRYSHGEAVAIGTVKAAVISRKLGVCHPDLPERLKRDFIAAGLPADCPVPVCRLIEAIRKDKKVEGNSIHFILIKDIGIVEDRLLDINLIINLLTDDMCQSSRPEGL